MRLRWASIGMAVAVALLPGCGEPNSPQGSVEAVRQAVQDNDLPKLKGLLKDEALRDWGNEEGMTQLRAKLGSYAQLGMSDPTPVSASAPSNNHRTARYEIDVSGTRGPQQPEDLVYRTLVSCDEYLEMDGSQPIWLPTACWVSGIR